MIVFAQRRASWIVLLILAVLLGGGWTLLSREAPGTVVADNLHSAVEAPRAGFLAPDFTLAGLDGEPVALSELRGRPVVLNFWATWCPPCRVEMPFFQDASRKYNGQVAILGISQGEQPGTVADFANQYGITYPLLPDTDSSVNRLYAVRALPTTLFVDADGLISNVHIGAISQAVLEAEIEALISKQ